MSSSPLPAITIIRPVGLAIVLVAPFNETFNVAADEPGLTAIESPAEVPVMRRADWPAQQLSFGISMMLPAAAAVTVTLAGPPVWVGLALVGLSEKVQAPPHWTGRLVAAICVVPSLPTAEAPIP